MLFLGRVDLIHWNPSLLPHRKWKDFFPKLLMVWGIICLSRHIEKYRVTCACKIHPSLRRNKNSLCATRYFGTFSRTILTMFATELNFYPLGSMYAIFTYISLNLLVNDGKCRYTSLWPSPARWTSNNPFFVRGSFRKPNHRAPKHQFTHYLQDPFMVYIYHYYLRTFGIL